MTRAAPAARRRLARGALLLATACLLAGPLAAAEVVVIGAHPARFGADGRLLPWTGWRDALAREMRFYAGAPDEGGYPRFVAATFLEADWSVSADRDDTIPAMQNGMGILSYLAYRAHEDPGDERLLRVARAMGDYLVRETLTPAGWRYARFTRSTGRRGPLPLAPDAAAQGDRPGEVEPDKGGIAGFALERLALATGEPAYLAQALQNARVLAANQHPGDRTHSPWPFRADARTGAGRGEVSGDMVYILRLYDALIARGYGEFVPARSALWRWIRRVQIPSAAGDGALFAQFFEDHDAPANRTAWAPLNLARYLLERGSSLDPDWRRDAGTLVRFVRRTFTHVEFGVRVCHEQDEDHDAWGGVNATYGAVLAMYARATGSAALAAEAREALNYTLYSIDDAGRPRDLARRGAPGGWQEDAHTDVIHNYVDALRAYPDWGDDRP